MTNAAVPLLMKVPHSADAWLSMPPYSYDPRFLPTDEKSAVTLGMGMTEKQGGTDVRANVTPRPRPWRSNGASPGTNGSSPRR